MTTIMNRLLRPIGPLRPHIALWNTASRIRSIRAVSTIEGIETSDDLTRAKRLRELQRELEEAKKKKKKTVGKEESKVAKRINQLTAEIKEIILIQLKEKQQAKAKAEIIAQAEKEAKKEGKAAIAEVKARVAAEARAEIAEAKERATARAIREAEEEARFALQNNTFYRSSEEPSDDTSEASTEFWAKRTHDELRELMRLSEKGVVFNTTGDESLMKANKYFGKAWHQDLHAMLGYIPVTAGYTLRYGDMVSLSASQMIERRQLT